MTNLPPADTAIAQGRERPRPWAKDGAFLALGPLATGLLIAGEVALWNAASMAQRLYGTTLYHLDLVPGGIALLFFAAGGYMIFRRRGSRTEAVTLCGLAAGLAVLIAGFMYIEPFLVAYGCVGSSSGCDAIQAKFEHAATLFGWSAIVFGVATVVALVTAPRDRGGLQVESPSGDPDQG